MTTTLNKPIVLCILDGWGHRLQASDNAISEAFTPTWTSWLKTAPHTLLEASGLAVGLPDGQMGNSEVGHLTIGAGRAFLQDLPRISKSLTSGELAQNPQLLDFISIMKNRGGSVHVMALLSPGGIHSHQDHIVGIIRLLQLEHIPVIMHAWLDGRDTPPKSALSFLETFQKDLPGVEFGTLSGRFYAMDRDKRWERTHLAYEAITIAKGPTFSTPQACVQAMYDIGIFDEHIPPHVGVTYGGIDPQDGLLWCNFRADRMKQMMQAFVCEEFPHFSRSQGPLHLPSLSLTSYDRSFDHHVGVLFEKDNAKNTLVEVIAQAGIPQFHIAETEKYAHVTYFLNGGKEEAAPLEDRMMIPSPKVTTYDESPEMSAIAITEHLCDAIKSGRYGFLVVNYANADMLGHTGNLPATIKAIEAVDSCLHQVARAVEEQDGILLVTADHGNAEQMLSEDTGSPHTAHTSYPVPFVIVGYQTYLKERGTLADIAPTILSLLNLPVPSEMTGQILFKDAHS